MTYEEMCRYVAAREGFKYWPEFIRVTKSRKEDVRFTRQLCMYLGSVCYPNMSYQKLGQVFNKDHATAMHAVQLISFEHSHNKTLGYKIDVYVGEITRRIYGDIKEIPEEVGVMFDKLMTTTEKMRIIAEAYCKITGKKIIDEHPKIFDE